MLINYIKGYLNQKKDEGFAVSLILAGFQLISSSFGTLYDQVKEVIILLNSTDVNESLKVHQEFSKTNWFQVIFGIFMIFFGTQFWKYIKHRLYILNINGYPPPLRIEDRYQELNLSRFDFKEQEIDIIHERKYEMNEDRAKYILELLERKVKSFIEQSRDFEKGYTGIAPIPFVAMAGTWLKKTKFDKYFEYDKKGTETYYILSNSEEFPELKDWTNYEKLDTNATEVVVAISTTAWITDSHLKQFNCQVVRLSVDKPKDNTIRSVRQLIEYKNKISEVIDKLPKIFPDLRKIHLVCATQSCLVLEVGKSIEEYRNIPIIAYHFDADAGEKNYYPWGIVLNGKEKGKFIKTV
jgi:hypothetical protein